MIAFWTVMLAFCSGGPHVVDAVPLPSGWAELIDGDTDAGNGMRHFRRTFSAVNEPGKGDGLGPLFNADSCITCHPAGGAAGNEHNVQLITLSPTRNAGTDDLDQLKARSRISGLLPTRNSTSFMLPRHSTRADYDLWRRQLMGLVGDSDSEIRNKRIERTRARAFAKRKPVHVLRTAHRHQIVLSERNTPALHGAGLIDRISKQTLQQIQTQQAKRDDGISGRIANVGSNRVGRFGWRGQTARLEDFVAGACRNEMGLQIRGQHELQDPLAPNPNLSNDLPNIAVHQLTKFISLLPAPRRVVPTNHRTKNLVATGRGVMRTIHCDRCHRESVGDVDGIFSDLLLHDMGRSLADPIPASPQVVSLGKRTIETQSYFGPSTMTVEELKMASTPIRQEWRTPPLWGVADSAPYLHDGRAQTLTQAIMMHDGEAAGSKKMFMQLNRVDQQALIAFLKSLRSP